MEFIAGQPLTAVMGSGIAGNPLDPYSTARVIADAADGLHAAHELKGASGNTLGLVHRDVSPGNIMVTHDGGVKIVDFGLAKARGRLTISGVQQFKGKVGYVAPEQLSGGVVDRRTDVFSLGVVMWEALALQRLFRTEDEEECLRTILSSEPPTPSAIRPEVPVELSAICLKALAPFPDYRFQTAGEMHDAIESFLIRVGYFRESGAIKAYMDQVFGRQHESRQRAVRRVAAATMTGDMPAIDVTFDDEDFPDLEVKYSQTGVGADPASDLARGTPTEQSDRHTASEDATVPLAHVNTPARANRVRTGVRREASEAARARSAPPPTRKRRGLAVAVVLLGAAAGLGGVAAMMLKGSDGSPGRERVTSVPHQAAPGPAPVASPAESGYAPAPVAAATPPAAAEPAPAAATRDASSRRHRAQSAAAAAAAEKEKEAEKKSAAELYEEGADLFVQGKGSAAKEKFKQAIAADSHYAPAFRGLGLVYAAEKRRDKAKKSFERYLQLRPGASDADAIRKRIEQLPQ
ncbi:MAG TPA: protein kinase, partial [Kofleriaceae bacterium]|nr:protein kinase [Kofleriaceae bacterium]